LLVWRRLGAGIKEFLLLMQVRLPFRQLDGAIHLDYWAGGGRRHVLCLVSNVCQHTRLMLAFGTIGFCGGDGNRAALQVWSDALP
jgi:hypothetical protein